MAVNLGDKPLAGFDEPLAMLKDCHRRIEHFLDVLRKVDAHFGDEELTEEGRRALAVALDYFANSAPRHTADEEHSLFPRLRGNEDVAARAVMADLDRLDQDHRRCEIGHELVDELGRRWMQSGRLEGAERERLRAALADLTHIYAAHIPLEEESVFPIAAEILGAEQIREIGEEMRTRRLLTPTGGAIKSTI